MKESQVYDDIDHLMDEHMSHLRKKYLDVQVVEILLDHFGASTLQELRTTRRQEMINLQNEARRE